MVSVFLYAFNPEQIRYTVGLGIEFFYSLILLAVSACLVHWSLRPSIPRAAIVGAMIGLSLACRSTLIIFPLAMIGGCLPRRAYFQRPLQNSLVILLLVGLPLLPWIARNAVQFRAFIPFERCAAANNLYSGSLGMVETWLSPDLQALAAVQNRNIKNLRTEAEAKDALVHLAFENIFSNPSAYIRSIALRLYHALAGIHPWLTALALLGLWRHWNNPSAYLIGLLVICFWSIHALMSIETRYFVPLTPLLVLLAACCFSKAHSGLTRRPREFAGPLRVVVYASLVFFGSLLGAEAYYLSREVSLWKQRPYADPCGEGHLPMLPKNIQSNSWEFYYNRGVRLYLHGRFEAALKDLKSADRLNPSSIDSKLSLAAALSRAGDHTAALKTCQEASRLTGQNSPALMKASCLDCLESELRSLGRFRDAQRMAEESHRLRMEVVRKKRAPILFQDYSYK